MNPTKKLIGAIEFATSMREMHLFGYDPYNSASCLEYAMVIQARLS